MGWRTEGNGVLLITVLTPRLNSIFSSGLQTGNRATRKYYGLRVDEAREHLLDVQWRLRTLPIKMFEFVYMLAHFCHFFFFLILHFYFAAQSVTIPPGLKIRIWLLLLRKVFCTHRSSSVKLIQHTVLGNVGRDLRCYISKFLPDSSGWEQLSKAQGSEYFIAMLESSRK